MHVHHDFTCGFLKKGRPPLHSSTPFSGKMKRVFFVLITSRLDFYNNDPRPSFRAPISGIFLFDKNTKVLDCTDLYSGLPPFTFSVTTNDECILLSAESVAEMESWIRAIQECIDNQIHLITGKLLKQSNHRPNQRWISRDVELGHVSLTYVTTRLHLKVRNHVKITSRSFVVELESPRYAHAFGICSGENTITFAASTEEEKTRWMCGIELRIAKQRVQWRYFQKPSDLTGYIDIRPGVRSMWRRRFVELERGALAIKAEERRIGTEVHVPMELITAVIADPPHDETGRTHAFTIERFGAMKLYFCAFSAAEKKNWLEKLRLARQELMRSPHELHIFPREMDTLMNFVGYQTVKVTSHEILDAILEQFRGRISIVIPTSCEEAATFVPKSSVLVSVVSPSGKCSNSEAMWHMLRTRSRPLKLTFRLPIAKEGLLRVKTMVPVGQWVPRHCVLENGSLKWFPISSETKPGDKQELPELDSSQQQEPVQNLRLRDCSVSLLRDLDPDFSGMSNCFVLSYPNLRVLFSASSAEDCVLWIAILQLEIATYSGDIRCAPKSPSKGELRRNSFVNNVRIVADKVYANTAVKKEKGESNEKVVETPEIQIEKPTRRHHASISSSESQVDDLDEFDDDEFLSLSERFHRNFIERPVKYIQNKKARAQTRTATYVAGRRKAFEAMPVAKRLSVAKAKLEVELGPKMEEMQKTAKKVTEQVKETARDVRSILVIPNPETSDYFDGTKRYLGADILGTSVRQIEKQAKRKSQRFIETESLVRGIRTGVPQIEARIDDVDRKMTLTVDVARKFFIELTNGESRTDLDALRNILRQLCVSEQGNIDNLATFEEALYELEAKHELTYAITIEMFVKVASATIHDAATVHAMEKLAKGAILLL